MSMLTMQREAVDLLVREHGQGLAFAYTLCGDREQAQDAVQNVLTRLLERDVHAVEQLLAYARRSVVNEITTGGRNLSRWRRRQGVLTAEWERELRTQPDPFGRVEVLSALTCLPIRQRAAIVMRYFIDLSDTQIAEALNCRPATVRSLVSRGCSALRRDLDASETREA